MLNKSLRRTPPHLSAGKDAAELPGLEGDVATESEEQLQEPPLYKVLLYNDDFTTREFVVEVLVGVFRRSEPEAVRIMLEVHTQGVGVAGIYTHEVAETKVHIVEQRARQEEFPLRLSIEPEANGC